MPFEVFNSREQSMAKGLAGQQGAALYQGNYTVIMRAASGDVTVRDLAIQEQKITVYLAREGDAIRFPTKAAQCIPDRLLLCSTIER